MSNVYNHSLTVLTCLSLALSLFACVLRSRSCLADDWPQWLGPQRLPVWNEEGVIDKFPKAGPPLRWKANLGGGYSGPAVANGRVFVMDRVTPTDDLQAGKLLHEDEPPSNQNFVRRLLPGRERVLCFRESDGKHLWSYEYDCPYTSVAIYAIGPRCTPTVDGDRVYTLGAEGYLVCLRVDDGSVVWERNFVTEFGLDVPEWGIAAHPIVDGERLICMVGGDGTTCVAFNKRVYGCGSGGRYVCAELKTGRRIWSTFAPSTGKRPASWANVFTIRHDDRYFLANDLGDLIIAKMTPSGYEELSRTHLIDPTHAVGKRTLVWSHPAFANRSIYLRNDKEIRCYSLASRAKSSRSKETTAHPVASKLNGLNGGKPDEKGHSSLSKAITLVDNAVAKGEVAGAVHLVGRDGATIHTHSAGVSDIETGEPITPDTIVRIYSMTKPITSVAAMTLYEQGKFQLDDPVFKYIPAFEQSTVWDQEKQTAVPPSRPITVRDVFRHTTGYSYDGDGDAVLRRRYQNAGLVYRPPLEMMPPDMTIEVMAEKLASIPAHHHPGERFTYGYSTDLLGRLIELWSGKPLDEFVGESVLEPLQMNDTSFNVSADRRQRFASCHTTQEGKLAILDKSTRSPFQDGFAFLSGGGGLTSTAADYAKFCQMLVDEGKANGTRILKPETLQLMFRNQLAGVPGDFRFGLGFAINSIDVGSEESRRTVTQYSWGGYASTEFRVVPELKLYQIFIRQHIPMKNELASEAFDAVYADLAL